MLIDAGWSVLANRKSPDDFAIADHHVKFDPAVDMPELIRYAKEKNVKLCGSGRTGHRSTNTWIRPSLLFEQWGIAGVKNRLP